MPLIKVTQIGVGDLGWPVLDAILANHEPKFDLTILARQSSSLTHDKLPKGVKFTKVDFESHSELVAALRGQDVLILTFGDSPNANVVLFETTKRLVDAAVDAGVRRLIPSEFGCDTHSELGRTATIFQGKIDTSDYIEAKAAEGKITYTTINHGPFFDWGLKIPFLGFDVANRQVTLYDDGEPKFNAVTLRSVAQAVVGVLLHLKETENKHLLIHDFFINQRQILEVLEAELGPFEVIERLDVNEQRVKSLIGFAQCEKNPAAWPQWRTYWTGAVQATFMGREQSIGGWSEKDDSELLGVPKLNFKTVVRDVVKELETRPTV